MIKQTALLKSRPGMDRDAFIRRYEQGHAPLVDRLLPYHGRYRRNYVIPGSLVKLDHIAQPPPAPEFDVITQIWYQDQAKLDALSRALAETGAGKELAEDEQALFDRTWMVMFATEEHETPPDLLQPRPAGHEGPPAVKQIALLRRKPGMSREDFIAYYEGNHAPLAMRLLQKDGKPLFARYVRNYPVPAGKFDMSHLEHAPAEIDFDVISEFWYWTQEDFEELGRQCAIPEIGDALARDEANFFDRDRISIFMVEEHGGPD